MRTRYSASRARQGVISAILPGRSNLATASAQAADDVGAGRNLSASCTACHGLNLTRRPGTLRSEVYGRGVSSIPGHHYSTEPAGASIVWSASNLNRWLSSSPAFIPRVYMQANVDNAQA
jgi:cytochrome c2